MSKMYTNIFIFECGRGGASGESDAQEKDNRESPMDIAISRNFRFPRIYIYIYRCPDADGVEKPKNAHRKNLTIDHDLMQPQRKTKK